MATKGRKPSAALIARGDRHGSQPGPTELVDRDRAERASDSTAGKCHPATLVAEGRSEAPRRELQLDAAGRVARTVQDDRGPLPLAEPAVHSITATLKSVALACDLATDCGCRRAYLAGVVEAIDELLGFRNQIAGIIGWPARQCNAVICSSHWLSQETSGSDASGKERQRSRTKKDSAGESRQTSRKGG